MNSIHLVKAIGVLACLACTATLLPTSKARAQFGFLSGSSSVEAIKIDELKALLAKQKSQNDQSASSKDTANETNFVLVDVRSDEEVQVSVIPGAITKAQYEKDREQYKGKTVIAYCTVGGRSGKYASELAKQGIPVKNFKGSILEWVNAELPLVTLDGKPTNRVHLYSDRYTAPKKYVQLP
jgi:rhodanese-related sulfurtransferase